MSPIYALLPFCWSDLLDCTYYLRPGDHRFDLGRIWQHGDNDVALPRQLCETVSDRGLVSFGKLLGLRAGTVERREFKARVCEVSGHRQPHDAQPHEANPLRQLHLPLRTSRMRSWYTS